MGKIGPSKEQIDSIVSILSIGKFQEALEETLTLSQEYPNESLLLNVTGACYQGLKQLETAVKYYEKSIVINPSYYKAHFNLGGVLQEQGKLNASIESFQNSLSIEPDYAEAHNNLGNVFKEIGQFDNAIKSLKKAIEINPNYVEAHYSLGIIFQDLNNLKAAISSFEKVLKFKPDFAQLHNNLGLIFQETGKKDSALKHFEDAVRIDPQLAESHNNLGNIVIELNQPDRALDCYKKAIILNPNLVEGYNNIGRMFHNQKKFNSAIENYEIALSIDPNHAESHQNLGNILQDLKQFDRAVECYQESLKINHNNAEVHTEVGISLLNLGELDASIKSFQKALSIDSNLDLAHNFLGLAFQRSGKLDKALKSFNDALSINSEYAEVYLHIGNLMLSLYQIDMAILNYEKSINLKPGINMNFGNLFDARMQICVWNDFSNNIKELRKKINQKEMVINPQALSGLIDDAKIQLKNSKIYAKEICPKNNILPEIGIYPNHKKIRIGYFSPDFREHPVSDLSAELYELHDRNQFEIHAFSFGPDTQDHMNLRIKAGVDSFHDVRMMSHKDIALLARSLEIDIAIDLCGYTAHHRAEVFAMSAAPIQVSYLGFPSTMGSNFMDYIIADRTVIPEDKQVHYSEKIAYMPNCYMINDSKITVSKKTITKKDAGLPSDSFIFCCFNNFYKINPIVFKSWMNILSKVSGSILWLPEGNSIAMNNLKKEFKKHGVDENRLFFAPFLTLKEDHLNRLQLADLFIDTFPFNAHTTCSDALRVSLPVLTCIGDSFTSRVASSQLNSMNLPELITTSPKHYESLAIELATDAEKLSAIKEKLKENSKTSTLYNAQLFTKQLETVYLDIYNKSQKEIRI